MIKRIQTSKEAYKFYKEKGGKESYENYMKVIEYFNKYVFNQMVTQGRVLRMGKLGTIMVATIWRNFNKLAINWKLTNENYKQGIRERVFYTNDYSLKYYYMRGKFLNRRFYKFKATRGINSNIQKLVKANLADKLLYKKYAQINKT